MTRATSQIPPEYYAALDRQERWRFWRNAALVVAAIAVAVLVVLGANWVMQKYIILGDDTARGERLREYLTATATGTAFERDRYVEEHCMAAARAFYGHGVALDQLPGEGAALPDEKAFFHACSGQTLGGHGGGRDGD
jgi:hypothetical protein